eukprot:SAG11_NODE_6287_length_1344_cov_0.971888_1_plen_119_part_00
MESLSLFTPTSEDVKSALPIKARETTSIFDETGKGAMGILHLKLTNLDRRVHVSARQREPRMLADLRNRKKKQNARHIHMSEDGVKLAELKSEVNELKRSNTEMSAKMDRMLEILENR